MTKERELRNAKRLALGLLLLAACVFVAMSFLPRTLWTECFKAISEAAMVGALADWFAVTALFRRVPLPLVSRHTAIIPRNKNKIADNLAAFVEEKFLDPASIVQLIRQHNPALGMAQWMAIEANAQRLGQYMVRAFSGMLEMTDDKSIQGFIKDALQAALAQVDVSKALGSILDTLTKDGRHQELLDQAIAKLVALLGQPAPREFIAQKIVEWLKTEHPTMEIILPTGWIGDHGAALMANAIDKLLKEIGQDPEHALRKSFDQVVAQFIVRLKTDPVMQERGEALKRYVWEGEAFGTYTNALWGGIRQWLQNDLERADSVLQARITAATTWVGRALVEDEKLRTSLNARMEQAANTMAPDFAKFLTRHISDTVKNWDAQDLSHHIELNIGKDLQYIRINGTIVGAIIGALLFGSSWLIRYMSM